MNCSRSRVRRTVKGLVAAVALALLAACGGGEQIEPFAPQRLFAFGDQMSVLTKTAPQGRKYTVNALDSDGNIACQANNSSATSLLWTQLLAQLYGFVFEECNPLGLTPTAFTYAEPDAKADDLLGQLAKAAADHGGFTQNDLMTVLVGENDVLELFPTFVADPTQDRANSIISELRARATRLGNAINDLTANCGPKVVVSTIPWMQYTPYALQQTANRPGIGVFNQLSAFSNAFNSALRTTLINDGRRWGLVELDSMVQAGVQNPASYGLGNITAAVCAAELPNCTTATLVSGGNPITWLWASDLWIGWKAHQYLGNYARNRASGNPFGPCTPSS